MRIEKNKLAKLLFGVLLIISTNVLADDNGVKTNKMLDSLYDKAWVLYQKGQFAESRKLVDGGLAIDPRSNKFAVLSALLYAGDKRCSDAIRVIDEPRKGFDRVFETVAAEKLDPVAELGGKEAYEGVIEIRIVINTILGMCHHDLGHWEESKKRLIMLEQEAPTFGIKAASFLADDYMMTKDYLSAQRYYTEVKDKAQLKFRDEQDKTVKEKMQDEYERAQYNLVITNFLLGDQPESAKWFKQLLQNTSRREYWIAKMKKDEDYVSILGSKEFQKIIETTATKMGTDLFTQ